MGWKDPERGGAPGEKWVGMLSLRPACAASEAFAGIKRSTEYLNGRLPSTESRHPPMHDSTIPCWKHRLGCAALFDGLVSRCRHRLQRRGIDDLKTGKNLICRVLHPGIRSVQLAGCLARQLTQLVAIGHMRKCPKNQIGTHYEFLLQKIGPARNSIGAGGAAGEPMRHGLPHLPLPRFRRTKWAHSSKSWRIFAHDGTGIKQYQRYGLPPWEPSACISIPAEIKTHRSINR
jgi:hypothetical protein